MPTVSAHVARTLARHIDHVFGVMGNGNAYFLDALERSTDVGFTAVRHEAGGVVAADAYHRARRRARRRDRDLRRRVHEHADRARRGGAGARAARARRRRRADLGPPPLGRRPDRPRLGGRRAHLHGRAERMPRPRRSSRSSTPSPTACRPCSRSPTTSPRSRPGPCPRRPSRGCPRRSRRAGRSPRRRSATSPPRSPAPKRPFLLAGRGAWIAGRRRRARRARRRDRRPHRLDGARPRHLPARASSTSA